jgi:TRAP-type C4-dicarboxylate transport system permease small subunit
MSEGLKNARNVAIILAIAAAVKFVPGGTRAAETLTAALWAAFALGVGYLGLRMYREHRMSLFALGDCHRGLLYGAVALGFFLWAVRSRLWYALQVRGSVLEQVHRWGGLGELLWFALAGAAVYSLVVVYRHWRAY